MRLCKKQYYLVLVCCPRTRRNSVSLFTGLGVSPGYRGVPGLFIKTAIPPNRNRTIEGIVFRPGGRRIRKWNRACDSI